MALVRVRTRHPITLTSGRDAEPNEVVNVNLANPIEAQYLADGLITIVDATTDPPPPPEPLRNSPRQVFVSRYQPDNMPVGSIWHELDANAVLVRTWEMT